MAVRIAGTTIPNEKRVEIALTYIYGIGRSLSNEVLDEAKVDKNKRVKDLQDEDINKIREVVEKKYNVEGDLRRTIKANIKRLKEIGSYRGDRHTKNLPVRGQSTKNNSRTARK